MKFEDAMKKALDFEQKGYDIYTDVSKTSFNPIVKKTFVFLAGEEQKHINDIKAYLEKENTNLDLKEAKTEDVKEFFNMAVEDYKEGIEFLQSDIEAYGKAMDLEKSAYDYYKQQHAQAQDEQTKKFLRFLMEQENAHYMLLEKMLRYLKDPSQFHAEEEEWIFEG